MRTRTEYVLIVDHAVESTHATREEALTAFDDECEQAFRGDVVEVREVVTTSTRVAYATGSKPLPPIDPDEPIRPLHSLFPEISVRRGGITYATPKNDEG